MTHASHVPKYEARQIAELALQLTRQELAPHEDALTIDDVLSPANKNIDRSASIRGFVSLMMPHAVAELRQFVDFRIRKM